MAGECIFGVNADALTLASLPGIDYVLLLIETIHCLCRIMEEEKGHSCFQESWMRPVDVVVAASGLATKSWFPSISTFPRCKSWLLLSVDKRPMP